MSQTQPDWSPDTTAMKMDALVKRMAELSAAADQATRSLSLMKDTLLRAMEEEQIKTHEVQDGGKIYRATYVQATTVQLDEAGLRQELGSEEVDRYCKKVLDRAALETAMTEGEVDPFIVGKHVTERKNKPSVRFSARSADDQS
jgi:hypothetical protein